jgi:hypothetical protein
VPQGLQRYFQQIRPLAKCDAEDGRIVGHLLKDIVSSKPKDPAHAIREFSNRTTMLRECGFRHISDMLVAMLLAKVRNESEHVPDDDAAQDPTVVTPEQATAIGEMLAAHAHSLQVPATSLQQVVVSHSILCTMTTRYSWFVPMLEVLLTSPDAADLRRRATSIVRRLSSIVTPQSNADFDSVVRARPTPLTSATK